MMQSVESMDLLRELFEEYSEWYFSLAEERGVLPRSISGVADNGKQFIYLIDDLTLQPMARNKYLRFVLDEHRSIAYAYGGLALRGDSDLGEIEEVLDVVAADSKQYVMGHWRVFRNADGKVTGLKPMGRREGNDPDKHPSSWFLAGAIRYTDAERLKYGGIWGAAISEVIFNDRNSFE
jgi:hypothetical protein